jgi:hypothetical protein
MTCSICNKEFCWLCGADYRADHFTYNLLLSGCPGYFSLTINIKDYKPIVTHIGIKLD